MNKIRFGKPFVSFVEQTAIRHHLEPSYAEMLKLVAQQQHKHKEFQEFLSRSSNHQLGMAEETWLDAGKPYYKIWPNMIDAIGHTSLNIDARYLHLPFQAFEIRLPIQHYLASHVGTSVLVHGFTLDELDVWLLKHRLDTRARAKEPDYEDILLMFRLFYYIPNDKDYFTTDNAVIRKNETLETTVSNLISSPSNEPDMVVDDSVIRHLFALAVAVSMFGVENHEIVMPDIPREVLTIKGKGKRKRITEQMRIDRELAKCKGWKVGSEIDLPRPLIRREGYSGNEGTGKELEHGHIRSGHMRMQPCGKGNKDRKLIFLPPTVVRPDLPMRTTRGYRIQDKLLAGSS